jgi:hypothetical protein
LYKSLIIAACIFEGKFKHFYTMSDNKSKTDNRDRTRINVNEAYELQYWSEKLNVTPNELRSAVEATGSEDAEKIAEYLRETTSNN